MNVKEHNAAKLALLLPHVRERALVFLTLLEQENVQVLVTSSFRTFEEQARLYRQGRKLKVIVKKAKELERRYKRPDLAKVLLDVGPQNEPNVVTNAAPGQTLHNYRCAFDVVPLRNNVPVWGNSHPDDVRLWTLVGVCAKRAKLDWGGSWLTLRDLPHIQYPGLLWQTLIK